MRERTGAGQRGFTLVEVLVALGVLAIAMGFAFRAFSGALFSLERSERQQMAVVLAQTMLDRVGRDIDLRLGDNGGTTSDGFSWKLHMSPYDNPADCVNDPGLQGIVVQADIGWIEQQHAHQVRLSSLRLWQPAGK
jgi:general secretion pathway protein I